IRRVVDGRTVARLDNQRVLRFSWDGTRVVTVPILSGSDVTLLEWQTGKVIWRQAGDPAMVGRPAFAMSQPNGTAMAIGVGRAASTRASRRRYAPGKRMPHPIINPLAPAATTTESSSTPCAITKSSSPGAMP